MLTCCIFIVHQLFVWVDEDPDIAFERAALLFEFTEVGWDMTRILWNGGVDVFNAGVIPIWNTATYYFVEPTVVLLLEVFSLVFTRQHWEGLMSEADFPYNGLDCTASAEAAAWCGRYGYYKAALEAPEYSRGGLRGREPAVLRESPARLQEPDNHTFTFGLATARRLQEQSGRRLLGMPAFPTARCSRRRSTRWPSFAVTMFPSLLDVVFGVLRRRDPARASRSSWTPSSSCMKAVMMACSRCSLVRPMRL